MQLNHPLFPDEEPSRHSSLQEIESQQSDPQMLLWHPEAEFGKNLRLSSLLSQQPQESRPLALESARLTAVLLSQVCEFYFIAPLGLQLSRVGDCGGPHASAS